MSTQPPEPGCGDCPSDRLCDTLRKLTARELRCPTVTDIARAAAIERLSAEEVRLLMAT